MDAIVWISNRNHPTQTTCKVIRTTPTMIIVDMVYPHTTTNLKFRRLDGNMTGGKVSFWLDTESLKQINREILATRTGNC